MIRCAASDAPSKDSRPTVDVPVDLTASGATSKIKTEGKRKKRPPIDYSQEYTDNIYIPAVRAMSEYLLKPTCVPEDFFILFSFIFCFFHLNLRFRDLEGMRKTTKRSPVTDSPPLTVYLKKDVEQKLVHH
jgi:hypothetical protein